MVCAVFFFFFKLQFLTRQLSKRLKLQQRKEKERENMRPLFFMIVLFVLHVTRALAYTHPDRFLHRHRGGELYAKSVALHESLRATHGILRNTTPNYFDQLIDHADPTRGTFRQRYFVDWSYWNKSGPVFIYTPGEGPATGSLDGYAAIVGKNLSALMITLEHRYYGDSLPAPLTDKGTLPTLRIGNVLADWGSFMDYIESSVVKSSPLRWVVVGGSYAGALSAWLKVTYPKRFVASWSSSGVVNPRFDFTSYDGHIAQVLPKDCEDAIRVVQNDFDQWWKNDEAGLKALFGTPDYFTKHDMAWMLGDSFTGPVQYGQKEAMCKLLVPQREDFMVQYAQFVNLTMGPTFGSSCGYSTKCLSDPMMKDQWVGADYAWIFQSCNEVAFWQIGYPGSIRTKYVSTDYFIDQCRTVFWDGIFPDVYKLNQELGGANPNAQNVIALQGSDDPFSTAGVQATLSDSYLEFTAVCDGCGHCGDLGYPSSTDSASLTQQREFILTTLTSWLA